MQVKFSSYGQTCDLEVRSNIIKFRLPCQFQRFLYQTLCVFSQIKDRKHIEHNFHSVAGARPQWWGLEVLGSKTLASVSHKEEQRGSTLLP